MGILRKKSKEKNKTKVIEELPAEVQKESKGK
jgi:hypothetical protein